MMSSLGTGLFLHGWFGGGKWGERGGCGGGRAWRAMRKRSFWRVLSWRLSAMTLRVAY